MTKAREGERTEEPRREGESHRKRNQISGRRRERAMVSDTSENFWVRTLKYAYELKSYGLAYTQNKDS